MTREEYQRASDIFNEVQELLGFDLSNPCLDAFSDNPEIQAQVLRMLRAHRSAEGAEFLNRLALADAAELLVLPKIGDELGQYRLLRQIGAGGMGVVYEAQDLRLERRVALKILASARNEQEAFFHEARATARLNHPNIAPVYNADVAQGHYYIAMECVEGQTLRQLIVESPGSIRMEAVLDMIGQSASALEAAHHAGIVHGDIKPENIMRRTEGLIKVLDFGLATMRPLGESGVSSHMRFAGTPRYLSPEQASGGLATAQSDLFSLGIVAYELATGVRPFEGANPGDVLQAILHQQPQLPSRLNPGCPPEFDRFVMRALQKDPALRFQTAAEMQAVCKLAPRTLSKRRKAMILTVIALAIAGASALWTARPPAPVRVTRITQITKAELPVYCFVANGEEIYFAAGALNSSMKMFHSSGKGSEPTPVPSFDGMFPLDISADHSQMMLAQFRKDTGSAPFLLWVTPLSHPNPRRLGTLAAKFARWTPKGDGILYSVENVLYLARNDGSDPREILRANGYIEQFSLSPDGKQIRFTVSGKNSRSLWESTWLGGPLHLVFPGWPNPWQEIGAWTPDGRTFVFSAGRDSRDLWSVREFNTFPGFRHSSPAQLTTGPFWASFPQPSQDGRRVYFVGNTNLGQLVRFNSRSKGWLPFLNGLDAMQVSYSADGKWISYVDSAGRLWRSGVNGTGAFQLTQAPLFARNPRWSPDGSRILFYGAPAGQGDAIYYVSAKGGPLTRLTHGEKGPQGEGDGNWSPDGSQVIYASNSFEMDRKPYLYKLTLANGQIERVPNSATLWSPRWSPDGRFVAALDKTGRLCLYDLETSRYEQLTSISAGFPAWARDGRSIYFENNSSSAWYRVGIQDRKVDLVQTLPRLKTALNSAGWVGLTLDGTVISARALNSSDVYALYWETP